jgi:hypothetical protein
MKCTGCGFINFDHLSKCRKCGEDLSAVRKALGLMDFRPNPPFLLKSLLAEGDQPAAEVSAEGRIPVAGLAGAVRTSTQDFAAPPGEAGGPYQGAIPWKVEESLKPSAPDPPTAKKSAAEDMPDAETIPQYYIDDAELEELAENLTLIQSPEDVFDARQNAQSPLTSGLEQEPDPFKLELESGSPAASTPEAEELLKRKGKPGSD